MRGMLDQDQILSPSLLKSATWVLTLLLAVIAALMLLSAIGYLFTGKFFNMLMSAAFGVGGPLTVWLIVRQLGEILLAQHRMNDRLTVLGDALREDREPVSAPVAAAGFEAPKEKPAKAKPAAKSKKTETTETPSSDKDD